MDQNYYDPRDKFAEGAPSGDDLKKQDPYYMPPPRHPAAAAPKKSFFRSFFRAIFRLIFLGSVILNIYLLVILSVGLHQSEYRPGDYKNKIALIDLQGAINMDTAQEIRTMLKKAQEDETVKAVILVINSPGGQVAPSDMINHYIQKFKLQKPLYAAIQQVGASGAYWIAVAANKIYAQTNSIVGSIGVIYVNMVIEKTLKDKLGVDPVIIKSSRSPFKDHNSPFRLPTDEEIQDIRGDLDTIHKRFVAVVQQGRDLDEQDAWKLADGDTHDGEESLSLKLVDKVGFLDDAIDDLTSQLKIENPMVIHYTKPPTLREILTAGAASMTNPLDIQAHLEEWAMTPRIMALWPGD